MAVVLGLGATNLTTPLKADEVDDFIVAQMGWLHIPGASLAVVKDGVVTKVKGYGWANLETKAPASADSVYKLGSLSKQFLATAILLLAEEGKLGLDDPVGKYLIGSPATWSKITIRHLLTHTSGLVREMPAFDPFKAQTDTEALATVAPLPLRFAPGEKWEYSNVGYYALAEIIRAVSGRPWTEFVAERVFAPAGPTATRATTREIVPLRAAGYAGRGRKLANAEDWLVVRPSGAFLSTGLDLAKWDLALSTDRILPRAARETMWTQVVLSGGSRHPYGFGWFVDEVNGHRRVRHDGGVPGFTSDFERFPDDRLTVILLVNRDSRDLRDLAIRVAGYYVPALLLPLEKPLPDGDPQVARRIRGVVEDFAGKKLDPGAFAGELGRMLVSEMNGGFGDDLSNLGLIEAFDLLEQIDEEGGRSYRFCVGFRHVPLVVRCTINREDKITKFSISD